MAVLSISTKAVITDWPVHFGVEDGNFSTAASSVTGPEQKTGPAIKYVTPLSNIVGWSRLVILAK